ncbi:MAG: sialate O-acetylesterase [Kiritimatiellia bacterium]|jgi:sialate O-acetylesterase
MNEPGDHGLYENMLDCIAKAGGKIRGFLWYQGCADTCPGAAESYLKRFSDAVGSWRKALGGAELPVVTVQLNRLTNGEGDHHWSIVREAQRRAAHEIPGVAVVPSLDLPLSDFIHTSAIGNLALGARMAQAALGLAYGKPVPWRPAEIASARRSADGMSVELAFDHVVDRVGTMDATGIPFVVDDIPGNVPIAGIDYPGGPRVVIRLLRPLQGPATVSAGEGPNPPTLPMDVERLLPILAFHAFPVD